MATALQKTQLKRRLRIQRNLIEQAIDKIENTTDSEAMTMRMAEEIRDIATLLSDASDDLGDCLDRM